MLYDYQCKACQHIFEKRLSMSDRKIPEQEPCPECGKVEVLQYISGSLQPAGQEIQEVVKPDPKFLELLGKMKAGTSGKRPKTYQ